MPSAKKLPHSMISSRSCAPSEVLRGADTKSGW